MNRNANSHLDKPNRVFGTASNRDSSTLANARKRPPPSDSPLAKRRMSKNTTHSVFSPLKPSTAATKENQASAQLTAAQLQSLYDTLETRTQESQLLRKQISLKDKELAGLKAELEDVSDMLSEIERNVAPASIKSSLAKVAAKKRSNDSDSDARIANLRQELAKRDEAILVQQKKVDSLQDVNQASRAEIERIVSYGEELENKFDNLALEKEELEGKFEEIKEARDKQIKTLVEELEKRSSLLSQYRQLLGEVDEDGGELMIDGKRYSDLKLEAERAQRQLESLERAHRDAKENLKHLSNEKTDMEEQWRKLHERLDEREKQYDIIESERQNLQEELNEHDRQFEQVMHSKEDIDAKLRRLQIELDEKDQAYEELRQHNDETLNELESCLHKIRSFETKINAYEIQMQELKESRDEVEAERDSFRHELQRMDSEIQRREEFTEETKLELGKLKNAQRENEARIQQLQKKLEDKDRSYEELKQENDDKLEELEAYIQGMHSVESKIHSYETEMKELNAARDELEAERDHFRHELARVEAEVQRRKEYAEETKLEIGNLRISQRDSEAKIQQLQKKLDDKDRSYQVLKQDNDERNDELESYIRMVHSLESKIKSYESDIQQLVDSRDEVDTERDQLLEELRNKDSQIRQLSKFEEAAKQYENEIDLLTMTRDDLEHQRQQLQEQLNLRKKEKEDIDTERRQLASDLQQQTVRNNTKLRKLETENVELRDMLSHSQSKYKQMEKTLQDKSIMSRQEVELQSKALADYKRQLAEARNKLVFANGKANEYEIEIAKANEATRERTLKIGELEQKVDQIKRELEGALSQRRQVAQVITELEHRVRTADADIRDAEDRATEMEKAAQILKDERDEFRRDLEKLKRLYEQQNKQYIEKVRAREHELNMMRQKQNENTHAMAESLKEKDSQLHELARDLARYKQIYQAAQKEKDFAEKSRDDCIADAQMLKEECLKQIRLLEQRLVHQRRS